MLKKLYKSLADIIEKAVDVVSPRASKIKRELEYYQNVRLSITKADDAYFKENDFNKARKDLYRSYELIFEKYKKSKGIEKEKLKSELEAQSLLIDILNLETNFEGDKNA